MSTKQQLLVSSALNAGGHLFLLLASFFSLPILIRSLGPDLFGQYLLLVGVPALAGLFDLGFGNGTLYYLSQDPSPTNWQKILGGNLLATLPMLLGAFVITGFGISWSLAPYVTLLVLVNQSSDVIMALAQSRNAYSIFNLKVVLVGLGNTLGSALIAQRTGSLVGVLMLQIIFQLLLLALVLAWLASTGYWRLPIFDSATIRRIFRYGLSTFGSTLAGQLQAQTARYYLSYAFTPAATAIYGLAQSLVQKGLTLIQVTGRSFFATSASLAGSGRTHTIRRIFRYTLTLLIPLGILAIVGTRWFGLPILEWWLGDAPLPAQVYQVLLVLSVWFLSVSLTPLTSYIGLGIGAGRLVSTFALSSVIVEVILMLVLTPRLGLLGPAYAALISSFVHTPPFLYLLWKKLNVST